MGVLTWRNVDDPNFSSVANINSNAKADTARGIEALARGGMLLGDTINKTLDTVEDRQISKFMAELSDKTPQELNAMRENGDLSKDSIESYLGKDVNFSKVIPKIDAIKKNARNDAFADLQFKSAEDKNVGLKAYSEYMNALKNGDTDSANNIRDTFKDNPIFTDNVIKREDTDRNFALNEARTKASLNSSYASAEASRANTRLADLRYRDMMDQRELDKKMFSFLSEEKPIEQAPVEVAEGNSTLNDVAKKANTNTSFQTTPQEDLKLAFITGDRAKASKLLGRPIPDASWKKYSDVSKLDPQFVSQIKAVKDQSEKRFDQEKPQLLEAYKANLTGNNPVTLAYLESQSDEKYSKIKTKTDLIKYLTDKSKVEIGKENSVDITKQVSKVISDIEETGYNVPISTIAALYDKSTFTDGYLTFYNSTRYKSDDIKDRVKDLGSQLTDPVKRRELTNLVNKVSNFSDSLDAEKTAALADMQKRMLVNKFRGKNFTSGIKIPSYSNSNSNVVQSVLRDSNEGLSNKSPQGIQLDTKLRNSKLGSAKKEPELPILLM